MGEIRAGTINRLVLKFYSFLTFLMANNELIIKETICCTTMMSLSGNNKKSLQPTEHNITKQHHNES